MNYKLIDKVKKDPSIIENYLDTYVEPYIRIIKILIYSSIYLHIFFNIIKIIFKNVVTIDPIIITNIEKYRSQHLFILTKICKIS